MIRLLLPANYKVPAHFHTGIEHVTVMSGTFNLGMGDKLDAKATRALGPGSVAIMQVAWSSRGRRTRPLFRSTVWVPGRSPT